MSSEKQNGFIKLKSEVIDNSLCCGCQTCVTVCPAKILDYSDDLPILTEEKSDKCFDCLVCYSACPRSSFMNNVLEDYTKGTDILGPYTRIVSAKSKNAAVNKRAQDGGVVTSILINLFENNLIDGAIVIKNEGWKAIPTLIYNKDRLIEYAGTVYDYNSPIQILKDSNNIIENIKELKHGIKIIRLAIVGLPCQIKAIKKAKLVGKGNGLYPFNLITYTIGLFCFENFYHDKLISYINSSGKISKDKIKKMDIKKGVLIIKSNDENEVRISVKDLSECIRTGCKHCDDFTNIYADISIGSVGSDSGFSSVIIRTDSGKKIYNSCILNEFLTERAMNSENIDQIKRIAKIKLKK